MASSTSSTKRGATSAEEEIRLSRTALKIYLYLLGRDEEVGPREIARAIGLSPSLVYYHLKRMEEMGLVIKGSSGYRASGSLKIEGFLSIGKRFFPRMYVYSAFFAGLLFSELLAIALGKAPVDGSMAVALLASATGFAITLAEGYTLYRRIFRRS
ncbi:MAG: winged helix-turn-helix transcriptional regulator [Crenarchaeota archaeon]|nr:winged helix-turn-helix transcriptional regulator [Thermoproteota archaeon]